MNIVNYEKLCISCCNLDCNVLYPVYNRYDEPGSRSDFYLVSVEERLSLVLTFGHEFREETLGCGCGFSGWTNVA